MGYEANTEDYSDSSRSRWYDSIALDLGAATALLICTVGVTSSLFGWIPKGNSDNNRLSSDRQALTFNLEDMSE